MFQPSVLDGPAVPLLRQLRDQGFELAEGTGSRLLIKPVARLTSELRSVVRRHKGALLLLIRVSDEGVQARRAVFRDERDASPGTVGPFLFRPGVPYQRAMCFSCGDGLPEPRFGRCWRCSLAWRLVCRLPMSVELARAYDETKVVA